MAGQIGILSAWGNISGWLYHSSDCVLSHLDFKSDIFLKNRFQLPDPIPGNGTDRMNLIRMDTCISQVTPTAFQIAMPVVDFGDDPDHRDVVGTDKIWGHRVLVIGAGIN
ncbi:hypothetical protein DSECCO2_646840 [anaerobic digester metagenome]